MFGAAMRTMILECARRCRKDTAIKRAFLRAIGVNVAPEPSVVIHVDESSDIRECFKNRRRVRL